tara:strand:- start:939 stop:1730 length:792 start_codon:yes stop_codon:yes gene_type:complete
MLKQERYDKYIKKLTAYNLKVSDKAGNSWEASSPEAVLDCMDLNEFLLSTRLKTLIKDCNTKESAYALKYIVHIMIQIHEDFTKSTARARIEYGKSYQSLRKGMRKLGYSNVRVDSQAQLKPHLYKLYKRMEKKGYKPKQQNEIVEELYHTISGVWKSRSSHERFRNRILKAGLKQLEKDVLAPYHKDAKRLVSLMKKRNKILNSESFKKSVKEKMGNNKEAIEHWEKITKHLKESEEAQIKALTKLINYTNVLTNESSEIEY